MGRRKTDSDGNDLTLSARGDRLAAAQVHNELHSPVTPSYILTADDEHLLVNMTWLCNQAGGWLRIVPSNDEQIIYIKWKFNLMPWPNHYVMVRCEYWKLSWGISLLRDKIMDVYAGRMRPSEDHAYEK